MDSPALRTLASLPSASLGHRPTPLHRLPRFSDALGAEVWAKRDDIGGVALAGNKVRKFDLVIGRALADGCDTLVTTGAMQSNSARTGAAAAAAVGLHCVLLLGGDEPAEPTANLLLGRLLGADIRYAGDAGWSDLDEGVDAIVAELDRAGRRAFAAPVGCSSPLGALGFARAFVEFHTQCVEQGLEPSVIVHTTTSGGTHAGLLVGRALTGSDIRIVGVDAGAIHSDMAAHHLALARDAATLIGHDLDLGVGDLVIDATQLGEGYGRPTAAADEALQLLARTEAILTDPVYSAKGLAGLINQIRRDAPSGPVVFWHTGGYHALFDPHYGTPQAERLER